MRIKTNKYQQQVNLSRIAEFVALLLQLRLSSSLPNSTLNLKTSSLTNTVTVKSTRLARANQVWSPSKSPIPEYCHDLTWVAALWKSLTQRVVLLLSWLIGPQEKPYSRVFMKKKKINHWQLFKTAAAWNHNTKWEKRLAKRNIWGIKYPWEYLKSSNILLDNLRVHMYLWMCTCPEKTREVTGLLNMDDLKVTHEQEVKIRQSCEQPKCWRHTQTHTGSLSKG